MKISHRYVISLVVQWEKSETESEKCDETFKEWKAVASFMFLFPRIENYAKKLFNMSEDFAQTIQALSSMLLPNGIIRSIKSKSDKSYMYEIEEANDQWCSSIWHVTPILFAGAEWMNELWRCRNRFRNMRK